MEATQQPNEPERAAALFLDTLWNGKHADAGIQLWEKGTKHTHTFTDLNLAATFAVERAARTDLYIAAGLTAARPGKPSKRRTSAADVVGIPGLWADIDINGGPESKTGAAPDLDAAMELAEALIEPTVIVNSGYGLQAWWLFEEPWIWQTDADQREQAHRLSVGFQGALRARAKAMGFNIDSTFDLARLMRLPGTLNHKGDPVPVELIEDDGPRHDLSVLHGIAKEFMKQAGSLLKTLTGQNVDVHLNGSKPPAEKLMELQDMEPDFDVVWNHRTQARTKDWSASEYDLSIASHLVNAGFADQEIADALRYHRRRFYPASDKGDRLDYLRRTIGRARGADDHKEAMKEEEFEREDTIEQLGQLSSAQPGEVPQTAAIALFTKMVGGPTIKELIQDGRDPANCRFKLVLADGREIPLGDAAGLVNQDRFRNSFMVATSHLPKRIKATKEKPTSWDDVVRALLNNALTVHDEDTRTMRIQEWLRHYSERRLSNDRDAAAEAADPFLDDGLVYVSLGSLQQWLRKVMGERIERIDLTDMLRVVGFERLTLNYKRADGTRSTRSYYRAPEAVLEAPPATDDPQEATPDDPDQ